MNRQNEQITSPSEALNVKYFCFTSRNTTRTQLSAPSPAGLIHTLITYMHMLNTLCHKSHSDTVLNKSNSQNCSTPETNNSFEP